MPEQVRAQSNEILNKHLAAAIDIHAQLKQAHWNVRGPAFIAIRELFDRISAEVEAMSDLIAERVAGLGGTARGTIQLASERSFLAPYQLGIGSEQTHLSAVAEALASFGTSTRATIGEQSPLAMRTPQTFSPAYHAISTSISGSLSRTMSLRERLGRNADHRGVPASPDEAGTSHDDEQGPARRLPRSITNWVNEGGAGEDR
ncbi:hypothetical protein GCM10008023_37000 [Sphingomonas glacialis]|uniref:Ferritin/DPS domain-containing protein n=1 Tax=Sphingomonas glacialis TaxID=658225 RepID=A0ABQ3LSI6_9SPHN|nr:hypothetical protein GCM10008023_37000 [Sphingomonas glacialis]